MPSTLRPKPYCPDCPNCGIPECPDCSPLAANPGTVLGSGETARTPESSDSGVRQFSSLVTVRREALIDCEAVLSVRVRDFQREIITGRYGPITDDLWLNLNGLQRSLKAVRKALKA